MFKNKQRIASAWAKGLMFGKAVGKRDERDRIVQELEMKYQSIIESLGMEYGLAEADIYLDILEIIEDRKNDRN